MIDLHAFPAGGRDRPAGPIRAGQSALAADRHNLE